MDTCFPMQNTQFSILISGRVYKSSGAKTGNREFGAGNLPFPVPHSRFPISKSYISLSRRNSAAARAGGHTRNTLYTYRNSA